MEKDKRTGFFMLGMLRLAYVTFTATWVAGSLLTPQITNTFFDGPLDPVI